MLSFIKSPSRLYSQGWIPTCSKISTSACRKSSCKTSSHLVSTTLGLTSLGRQGPRRYINIYREFGAEIIEWRGAETLLPGTCSGSRNCLLKCSPRNIVTITTHKLLEQKRIMNIHSMISIINSGEYKLPQVREWFLKDIFRRWGWPSDS